MKIWKGEAESTKEERGKWKQKACAAWARASVEK